MILRALIRLGEEVGAMVLMALISFGILFACLALLVVADVVIDAVLRTVP